jgi:putative OPT family oligopeptide transporter
MFIGLIIGTAVCTALSTSGALISDFKIGYWIGSTPRNQQIWKFLGIAVAAITVAFIIPVMDNAYHFLVEDATGKLVSNQEVLPAPQANMLGAVISGMMSGKAQPVLLYILGGLIAIMLYLANVPMLAFALGMYLPISITSSQLAGGFVAWIVSRSGKNDQIKNARREQGTLIASGMMAGAAIVGIVSAVMRLPEVGAPIRHLSAGVDFFYETTKAGNVILQHKASEWFAGFPGQGLSLALFVLLGVACFALARKGAHWEMTESGEAERDK